MIIKVAFKLMKHDKHSITNTVLLQLSVRNNCNNKLTINNHKLIIVNVCNNG